MIFMKVYSWRRIKRVALILLISIVFIMIFFSTLLWDWEEKAVFRTLREDITLIIPPGQPAVVYLNGEKIGQQRETMGKTPYIYTAKADDMIHIRMEPLHTKSGEIAVEKTLVFENGKLIVSENQDFWNHLSINEWPNQVYEVLINLPTSNQIDTSKNKILIKEEMVDLDQDNDLESLQLIKQGEDYFIQIDQAAKVILKNFLEEQFQWSIKDINEDNIKEIIIKGSFGESHRYIEIFQFQQEQLKRIFWEYGEDIAVFPNGKILVGKRLFDTVDHYNKNIYHWKENEYQKSEEIINWWQGNPKWPTNHQKTVKAFFEAYQLGLMEEAQGYVISEYQNSNGVETIINQVQENWRQISPPLYYFLGDQGEEKIYIAFYYDTDIHPRYNKIRVYEIELEYHKNAQGPWKIKNIQEAKDYSLK